MQAPVALQNQQKNERKRLFHHSFVWSAGLTFLILSFSIVLNGCSLFTAPAHGTGTPIVLPSPTLPVSRLTPVQSPSPTPPTITLQVVNCPTLSINWDSLVGTKVGVNKVQKVACGSFEGGALAALVNVRYYSSDAKLDVYVYDNLYGTPYRRFSLLGLLDGDALISPTNTIMTAEIGPKSTFTGAPDLYKEYQWNGSTFAQILFPGMYPDMTHYQAERDQAQVSQGFNTWKTQQYSVIYNLATKVFHWPNVTPKQLVFSNSTNTYTFAVTNLGVGGGGFTVTMVHLDGVLTNILEVTSVASLDGSTQLSSPGSGVSLTSPVTVSGSANVAGSVLGRVLVYDNTYLIIGDSGSIPSPTTSGLASFTKAITYSLNASGLQEGVVAFYSTTQSNDTITNQVVMVKVFLSA